MNIPQVHVIDPEDDCLTSSTAAVAGNSTGADVSSMSSAAHSGLAPSSDTGDAALALTDAALEGFERASMYTREVATAFIATESALINQRLMGLNRMREGDGGGGEPSSSTRATMGQDTPPKKKRRVSNPPAESNDQASSPAEADSSASLPLQQQSRYRQEQESVWSCAARTKRMSWILQNMEMMHRMLLDEMTACMDDNDMRNQHQRPRNKRAAASMPNCNTSSDHTTEDC